MLRSLSLQVDIVRFVDYTRVRNVVVANVGFQALQLGERLEHVDTFPDVDLPGRQRGRLRAKSPRTVFSQQARRFPGRQTRAAPKWTNNTRNR
jgi:hypothetical protein